MSDLIIGEQRLSPYTKVVFRYFLNETQVSSEQFSLKELGINPAANPCLLDDKITARAEGCGDQVSYFEFRLANPDVKTIDAETEVVVTVGIGDQFISKTVKMGDVFCYDGELPLQIENESDLLKAHENAFRIYIDEWRQSVVSVDWDLMAAEKQTASELI